MMQTLVAGSVGDAFVAFHVDRATKIASGMSPPAVTFLGAVAPEQRAFACDHVDPFILYREMLERLLRERNNIQAKRTDPPVLALDPKTMHTHYLIVCSTSGQLLTWLVSASATMEALSVVMGLDRPGMSIGVCVVGLEHVWEPFEFAALPHVPSVPIINSRPHSFFRELQIYLTNGDASSYEDEQLALVGVPMLAAQQALSGKDFHGSKSLAMEVQDPGWRAAAIWWIDRSFAKHQERK